MGRCTRFNGKGASFVDFSFFVAAQSHFGSFDQNGLYAQFTKLATLDIVVS